ncbi:low temperature requirement protein A [uncultured Arthrobacter sp.]|uniref:low temperature requirement protein A n=1 Tax=uncultured Arthrobacter sp. TaxID=114050 RepID=UPI0025D76B1C|nr:low temperature requirement protein A [uncultured Arthrobacter sp.]
MALSRKALPAARVSDESHRVTTFELFFDLVFVFAFTRVTGFMAHEHSFLGVLQGMIILTLLWWSWVSFSWLSNQTHVDEGIMRLGLSVVMVAMFISSLAIPEAFHDLEGGLSGPLVLALSYAVVRVLHLTLYAYAAGNDEPLRRQIAKTAVGMVLGSALIVTGALVGGPAQTWFWLAGVGVDAALTYLTSKHGNWRVHSAAHWTERYGLIVILALGESIVAIGVGASQEPVSTPILIGAVFGVALSICLWWLHFDVTAIAAEHRFAALRGAERASAAVDGYTYLHLPLVAGIVLSALGVEDVLAHVYESGPFGALGAFALLGGAALYLLGSAGFWRRIGGGWKKWRLGGAAALLALIPVAAQIPPLAALVLVSIAAAVLVALESLLYQGTRLAVRSGH